MGGVESYFTPKRPADGVPSTELQSISTPPILYANYDKAVTRVLNLEGGFVNHKADRGGPTNHGITQATLSRWLKRQATLADVQSLTKDEAKKIYKAYYWDPLNLEGVQQYIAEVLFDQAVNFGPSVAVKRAQRVLNNIQGSKLLVDGDAGPKTKEQLMQTNWRKFIAEFMCQTQDDYVGIVVNNSSQIVFLAGWINRSQKMLQYLI